MYENSRFPVAFNAYQLQLGEDNSQIYGRGGVSISIGEIFSVYVPPSADGACEWLDLKVSNIWKIEPTNDIVPGDIRKHLKYLKLHLSDYEADGHLYLMSMRPLSAPVVIMIACHTDEADDIVENIERCRGMAVSRIQSGGFAHVSAVKGLSVNPEVTRSQQEKEKELKKRLGYVVDAVNSPLNEAASSDNISSTKKGGEGGASSISGPGPTHDGRSGSMASQKRNRKSLKVQEASAARVSRAQETSSRGVPQMASEDSIPTPLPLPELPLPFAEEFDDQGAPDGQPIPRKGDRIINPIRTPQSAGQQGNQSYGQEPRRSESATGLVDLLNRVPSLIPLESLKKRGKLKDRLANKEGRILQPSTEKAHKARGRPANPKTPTNPAKPERQRKRPEPLPEGDDIWDIPLDESEAERPAKRGRPTKQESKAKPPPRPRRQAGLPKPKPKAPANNKATTASGSAIAQPSLRRSLRTKAPLKTAANEISDQDLSEAGTAAPIQEPRSEARPPLQEAIQKPPPKEKREPPKSRRPGPLARRGGEGHGSTSVEVVTAPESGERGPSRKPVPANPAQRGGKAEGVSRGPKVEQNSEVAVKPGSSTKRKAQTPSNGESGYRPRPAETPGGPRKRQRPMTPMQDNLSYESSPVLEFPLDNEKPGTKTFDAVGYQSGPLHPISKAASAAVSRLLQVQRRDMQKSEVRVINNDEAELSRDAVGRRREPEEKHLGPVEIPGAFRGRQGRDEGLPARPGGSLGGGDRSGNYGLVHCPAPILVDASTSTTDHSDDRLIAGTSSRTSSPQKKPADHKPMISQARLPDQGPRFAPSSASANLVDEHLAKRPQVISWNRAGPENQGRTPETARSKGKERETRPLDLGGFGGGAVRLPEGNFRPSTGQRFRSYTALADEGGDKVALNEEEKLLRPWIPARTGTGLTEVYMPNAHLRFES